MPTGADFFVHPALPETVPLFGLRLSCMTYAQTLSWLHATALQSASARACVFSANVDQIVRCHTDPQFREIYKVASLIVPDGMPVVWSARFLQTPLPERVTGIDLLFGLCGLAAQQDYRCFLLGARPAAVERAVKNLESRFPGLAVCGWHQGYFFQEEDGAVVAAINAARPAILFVGMGSPRQELWLRRNFGRLNCQLALPVGGAFDVIAGIQSRAPMALQKLGMEWSWRLLQEPRRLWRRYLLDDLKFLPMVYHELRARQRVSN